MIEYPDKLLRGLSADDWVSGGIVTAAAFQIKFEPKFMRNEYATQSICWEDDSSVVDLMMQQKKKDNQEQFQFRVGIARSLRNNIDHIMKLPVFRDILSYERDILPDNKYHGNLLVSPKINRAQKNLLPANIASQFSDIIPRA